MKITLFGKAIQKTYYPIVQQILDILSHHASFVYIYKPFYEAIKDELTLPDNICSSCNQGTEQDTDFIFTLGGDGTFLDALNLVIPTGIPMLGINIGRLGFLSSVNIHTLEQSLIDIKNNNYSLEKRMLLHLEPQINGQNQWALNDICIQRNGTSSMISISVHINDEYLNTYWCDGLIIATPTGSTAYSLGCGGPILMPDSEVIVLTPIASHMLTVRPVVIPDNCCIRIQVKSRNANFVVSTDSTSFVVDENTSLHISKEKFYINLVRLPNHTFSKTLREKLMWGLDKRN